MAAFLDPFFSDLGPSFPFTLHGVRQEARLVLVPHPPSPTDGPSCALSEAVVSLYRHVLPNITHRFIRRHLYKAGGARTVCVLREPGYGRIPGGGARGKEEGEGEGEEGDEDDTSGFSEDDDGDDDGDGQDDDDDQDEEEEEGPDAPVVDQGERRHFKDRILGAITLCHVPNNQRIDALEVVLLGTRLRYQGLGLARRMMTAVKSRVSLTHCPLLITHADHTAKDFFAKSGFNADAILNSRYAHLTDPWDQSVVMSCVLPRNPPPVAGPPSRVDDYLGLGDVEKEMEAFRERRVNDYALDLAFFEKLQAEVAQLRQKLMAQEVTIQHLTADNARLRALAAAAKGHPGGSSNSSSQQQQQHHHQQQQQPGGHDGGDWRGELNRLLGPGPGAAGLVVEEASGLLKPEFEGAVRLLREPRMVIRGFFKGDHLPHEQLERMFSRGFSDADVPLRFTRHPVPGATFHLFCEVAVGNAETVTGGPRKPGPGFDSIVVPSSVRGDGGRSLPGFEEYCVFGPYQARVIAKAQMKARDHV